MIRKSIFWIIAKLWGWENRLEAFPDKKCILIAAPHTSAIDFLVGYVYYAAIGGYSKVFIKKEMFYFPLGLILKAMGAVPVERGIKSNLIESMSMIFQERDKLHLTITPEGTRKKTKNWKRGFWVLAKKVDVPVYLVYMDYKKKEIGCFGKFELSDCFNDDIQRIKNIYKNVSAKNPEMFDPN